MADAIAPFKPSLSLCVNASTTAPSGTLINMVGDWTLLAYNRSQGQDAYLFAGPTSALIGSATIPAVNSPPLAAPGFLALPIPQASLQCFTFSGPTFIGGATASGNAQIDIVVGQGS